MNMWMLDGVGSSRFVHSSLGQVHSKVAPFGGDQQTHCACKRLVDLLGFGCAK
jgi:hypothetical protein